MLVKEQNRLENIVAVMKNQLETAPEGSMRLSISKNKISYYHYQVPCKSGGTYISRKNEVLIHKLAQKSYNEKVLSYAEKRLRYVRQLADIYEDSGIEEIFCKEHPDFTVLSKRTRREWYWEHNGKMDDPGYARKAIKKLQNYEKNNIFVGEKLILTYETEQNVIQTKDIERLAKKYLL